MCLTDLGQIFWAFASPAHMITPSIKAACATRRTAGHCADHNDFYCVGSK
jgi:hypothetical protein